MLKSVKNYLNSEKIMGFFSSMNYPIFLFAVVLLTHCLALDIIGFIITVICFSITTVFCDDLRPALPFVLLFPYVVSTQNSPGYEFSHYYASPFVLGTLVALGILVILSLTVRVIVKKEYKLFFNFKQNKLLLGFLLLIPCYSLAGLFSGYLDVNSAVVSVIMIILQPIIYLVFASGIKSKEDNVLYLAKVASIALILMCLEIAFVYILKYDIGTPLNENWKAQIIVGSVVSNSAGEFIVILMPFLFYLAYKEKHGYVYYIIAALSLIAIYFTLSRASLLFGLPTFIAGTILLCFKGNHKKIFRIISALYTIAILSVLIYVYASGYADGLFEFFKDAGFSSRGRFKIWSQIFEKFKSYPIFGVGFSTYMQTTANIDQIFKGLAHNTAVQVLCSTGIIGTLLFSYHIFEVLKVFCTKIKLSRVIIGVSILLFLGISLVDQIFFFPNFTIIYTLFLVFAERDVA
ncbi:MAG: O-antigen ligase family protein [Clostridia bacterium]|nr:O-antigen ligase family protein [Clostridia bacterium]